MNFSEALEEIKNNKRLKRVSWPKGFCIYLSGNPHIPASYFIECRLPSGSIGYSASSSDLLANDWEIAE